MPSSFVLSAALIRPATEGVAAAMPLLNAREPRAATSLLRSVAEEGTFALLPRSTETALSVVFGRIMV